MGVPLDAAANTGNWHEALRHTPQALSLFKALLIVEQSWNGQAELAAGLSDKIHIVPDKALSFAGLELTACREDLSSGRVELTTTLAGLYGVNSPLPHYFLELAASDESQGQRLRAFLNVFNHLLYCQRFQVWKKSRPTLPGPGAALYDTLLNCVLGDGSGRHAGMAGGRSLSCSVLCQVLRQALDLPCLWVTDSRADWLETASLSLLGEEASAVLGDSALLGTRVLAAGRCVDIRIGPVSRRYARALSPGARLGHRMARVLQQCLPPTMHWCCTLSLEAESPPELLPLGCDTLVLADNSYLGQPALTACCWQFKQARYLRELPPELSKRDDSLSKTGDNRPKRGGR